MNLERIFNDITRNGAENAAEGFFSRLIGRFTSGAIINIITFLFVAGILLMVFIYVGFILLRNL